MPTHSSVEAASGEATRLKDRWAVASTNLHANLIMRLRPLDSEALTSRLEGRQVMRASVTGTEQITLQFSDGTALIVETCSDGLVLHVAKPAHAATADTSNRPTQRQLEYLLFIDKYMRRFGRAPAESDIERHFLVSAPSVNSMIQTLERRGFITRQPGVPRSIRLSIDLSIQEH